jgi:hypothetical protein
LEEIFVVVVVVVAQFAPSLYAVGVVSLSLSIQIIKWRRIKKFSLSLFACCFRCSQ